MLKTICNMLAGALVAAAVGSAFAVVGTPPIPGPGLVDGQWLTGLAGGLNNLYQAGITATGTTQATGAQLPSGILLVQVDTAAASTGVNLPPCIPGTELNLYNNGASTLAVYPAVANNPITAAQDTINNAAALSGGVATHVAQLFFCAKAGVWASK